MKPTIRLLTVAALTLATAGYLALVMRAEPVPVKQPLSSCPLLIDTWQGQKAPDFDPQTLAVLGVDEYISRVYSDATGGALTLYVGYYESQRQGDTMHSPLNCLPGAGWSPVSFDRIGIPVRKAADSAEETITVNRYVIEKGLDRQMVLYWYQSQGRVIASEYWGKFYLVLDAIRHNRTDGALVRIVVPIQSDEAAAEGRAVAFAKTLYPLLGRYLPS